MTFGLDIFNTGGQSTFSLDNGAFFFKGAGVYNSTTAIPAPTFYSPIAISTPVTLPSLNWNGNSGGGLSCTVDGASNASGTSYIAAAANTQYGTLIRRGGGYFTVANSTSFVHQFGVPYAYAEFDGWGLMGVAANGVTAAISKQYKTFYAHPTAGGAIQRFATAVSCNFGYGESSRTATLSYAALSPTIVFDQPHTTPPLIFVTNTNGGKIALVGMTRDVNGKYVSATVVCPCPFGGTGFGQGWYGNTSVDFSYYIVSQDAPLYAPATGQGMQMWDDAGALLFDGRYQIPSLYAGVITTPYVYNTGSTVTSTSGAAVTRTPSNLAVCLNNINPLAGAHINVMGYLITGGGSYIDDFSRLTSTGRLVSVDATTITVVAESISSLTINGYDAQNTNVDGRSGSSDFNITQNPTMTIVMAATPL